MWVNVGDGANRYDVFTSPPVAAATESQQFVRDFHGTLLADGYGGYDGVVVAGDLVRAACMVHARSKFVAAEKSAPRIEREAVDMIGRLHDTERRAEELSDIERLTLRQAESRLLLDLQYVKLSV
jgi:hypothetical protein